MAQGEQRKNKTAGRHFCLLMLFLNKPVSGIFEVIFISARSFLFALLPFQDLTSLSFFCFFWFWRRIRGDLAPQAKPPRKYLPSLPPLPTAFWRIFWHLFFGFSGSDTRNPTPTLAFFFAQRLLPEAQLLHSMGITIRKSHHLSSERGERSEGGRRDQIQLSFVQSTTTNNLLNQLSPSPMIVQIWFQLGVSSYTPESSSLLLPIP